MDTATQPARTLPEAVLDEVVTALRRGDAARAERALASAASRRRRQAMLRLAELNMRRRRWHDAAWLFDTPAERATRRPELKRRLSKNLACLQRAPPRPVRAAGQPAGGPATAPSASPRPACPPSSAAATTASRSACRPATTPPPAWPRRWGTAAVPGQGPGVRPVRRRATATCCTPWPATRRRCSSGMRQPVFVLEPDPQVLLHCLMIHDYTGPAGADRAGAVLLVRRAGLGRRAGGGGRSPTRTSAARSCAVPLGLDGPGDAGPAAAGRADRLAGGQRGRPAGSRPTTPTLTPPDLAALFGPSPPRRPRVLLLTTRFSSVLQYSTRDAAEGFRQIGWDARVVIEPTPAHRLYRPAIRRALDEFKPDLVFQIDHLRHEHGDLFPPNLPFACWVQDHLPNLTSDAAGAAVGPRDFVLVGHADDVHQPVRLPAGASAWR